MFCTWDASKLAVHIECCNWLVSRLVVRLLVELDIVKSKAVVARSVDAATHVCISRSQGVNCKGGGVCQDSGVNTLRPISRACGVRVKHS